MTSEKSDNTLEKEQAKFILDRVYSRQRVEAEIENLRKVLGLSQLADVSSFLRSKFPELQFFSFRSDETIEGEIVLWPMSFISSDIDDLTHSLEWDSELCTIFDSQEISAQDLQQFSGCSINIAKFSQWEPSDGVTLADETLDQLKSKESEC